MRADLASDAVFERRDDLTARGVIFGVGREDQHEVEGQPDGIALNLHVAFLHDIEQAHLDFAGEVGQLIYGEDAAIGARQQAVVHRQLVGNVVPAARRFDGVDIADHVGDGDIRGGKLFHIALLAAQPGDGGPVRLLGNQVKAAAANGMVRIIVNLATVDVGRQLIQHVRQHADQPGFGLAAKAQQDKVVARENGVDDLGHDRVVEPQNAGKQRFPALDFAD